MCSTCSTNRASGLHPRDNQRLISMLRHLRDLGNSVIVVEHDEDTIRAADHLVDFGPGAGHLGGKVVFEGPPSALDKAKGSLTADYVTGRKSIEVPAHAPKTDRCLGRPRRARK